MMPVDPAAEKATNLAQLHGNCCAAMAVLAAQLAERAKGDPLKMGFQPWR